MTARIRDFVPGPVHVTRATREAMTREMLPHRSPEFRAVWDSISSRLPGIFRSARPAMVATGSSTLLMQAALQSLVRRDVLHLVNGAFSERWAEVGRSLGRSSDEIVVEWGQGVDPDLLRGALRRKRYEAVTLAHNETSTGVVQPLEELAQVVREESDALVLVDAVSSLAADRLETDAWGLDFVFAGSQKGLAAPPGLTVFSMSERAEQRAEGVEHRGFYTDLLRYRDQQAKGGPITTPAVPVVYALERQLVTIAAEGLEARWDRHRELAERTAEAATRLGLELAAAEGVRSRTVTCLRPPAGVGAPELVRGLLDRGYRLASGYGRWKPSTFRIGHMGEVREADLVELFQALEEEIRSCTAS